MRTEFIVKFNIVERRKLWKTKMVGVFAAEKAVHTA